MNHFMRELDGAVWAVVLFLMGLLMKFQSPTVSYIEYVLGDLDGDEGFAAYRILNS